ncbi:MAG TPA: IS3 family transposase [Terriglobales bacterium]|nr:IS3 family transposase [Terriglobales bacterium]
MSRRSQHHTEEFKTEAVELVERSGKSVPEIADELGINERTLYHWMAKHKGGEASEVASSESELAVENKRLRRELEIMRQERDILKKANGRVRQGVQMRYAFIAEHAQVYPVRRQCRVLEVAESGYYAWHKAQSSNRQQGDERLTREIRHIYQQHRGLYGSPRIHATLKAKGCRCSRKRVARLMREAHLRSVRQRKRRIQTTHSKHPYPVAANLLNQQFEAQRPNQKWVADITYIPTRTGWLYLAAVLDLFSRRIVGWAISARCDATLVQNALQMAFAQRQLDGELVHHSDRGSQYAAHNYQDLLAQHHITVSMSRTGNCYDNAVMESFFRTLKAECVDLHVFHSHAHARSLLFEFVEVYYNRQRLHSSLAYCTPAAFEAAFSH